jgi:glycine/D-amino acid oxidase-like deaminating enzyme
MAEAFATEGGRLMSGARVAGIDAVGSRCSGVTLSDGRRVTSRIVVVATGPWSNDLLAPLGLAIPYKPVRFEAAETGPSDIRIGPVVSGQSLFRFFTPPGTDPASLPRDPTEMIRPELGFTEQIASYPDGSLQFGCAYEIGTTHDRPTVAGQAMACAITSRNFPSIATLPVVRQWAGIVAQTPDGLPVIDATSGPEGLILNTGHFFGNLAGAFSGRIVSELATGKPPAYPVDGFSQRRFA